MERERSREEMERRNKEDLREAFIDGIMPALDLFIDLLTDFREIASAIGKVAPEIGIAKGRFGIKTQKSVYRICHRWQVDIDGLWRTLCVTTDGALYAGKIEQSPCLEGDIETLYLRHIDREEIKSQIKHQYLNGVEWIPKPGVELPMRDGRLGYYMAQCTYRTKEKYFDRENHLYLISLEKLPTSDIQRNVKQFVMECAGLTRDEAERALGELNKHTPQQKAEKALASDETSAKTGRKTNNYDDKRSEISFINTNEKSETKGRMNISREAQIKEKLVRMSLGELMKYEPQNEEERQIMIQLLKEYLKKTYGK